MAEQVAALSALRDAIGSDWLQKGNAERAASAERAAQHLDRFLARLRAMESKQGELGQFEYSLTGTLPDQMNRLWRAIDAREDQAAQERSTQLALDSIAPDVDGVVDRAAHALVERDATPRATPGARPAYGRYREL